MFVRPLNEAMRPRGFPPVSFPPRQCQHERGFKCGHNFAHTLYYGLHRTKGCNSRQYFRKKGG